MLNKLVVSSYEIPLEEMEVYLNKLNFDIDRITCNPLDLIKANISSFNSKNIFDEFSELVDRDVDIQNDLRYQTFLRFELELVNSYTSYAFALNYTDSLIKEVKSCGLEDREELYKYYAGALRSSIIKCSLLERIFMTVDCFLYEMNKNFSIDKGINTSKNKSQLFNSILSRFQLLDESVPKRKLVEIFCEQKSISDEVKRYLLEGLDNKKITYGKLYEYFSMMRNTLHNNGFVRTTKKLNEVKFGKLSYAEFMEDDYYQGVSFLNVSFMIFCISYVLKDISVKSFKESDFVFDEFMKKRAAILGG